MLLGLKPLLCKEASKIQKLKIFEAFESFLMFGGWGLYQGDTKSKKGPSEVQRVPR
jgi:hypothetical protein